MFLLFAVVMMNFVTVADFDYENNVGSIKFKKIEASAQSTNTEAVDRLNGTGEFAEYDEQPLEGEGGRAKVSDIETDGNFVTRAFKVLLWGILTVIHKLVLVSAFIFDATLKQVLFDSVVRDNSSIYIAWAMVRDFLNLFFMLALLFSAFSTVFQVEKYHLKKVIILLVVMALLVNFSYPITLFVIDFSNSVMYFFVSLIPHSGNAVSQSALVAKMADVGMLSEAVAKNADIPALVLSIIFQFILFVTLFAFAINLLIRILAFAILLIFSPAGFTLSFFPSTGNIADSWWSNLIKYAVMGPLMIFFLLIANLVFDTTESQSFAAPERLSFLGSSLVFALPVVFIWMGLIASNKFGGDASNTAMGVAKKTKDKINGYAQKGMFTVGRATGRGVDMMSGYEISGTTKGIKQRIARWNEHYKSKSDAKAAKFAEHLGVTGAEEQNMMRLAGEYKKRGLSNNALKDMATRGDAAAAFLLAEKKKMDQETLNGFMKGAKNENVRNAILGKVKQNRVDLVAIHKATNDKEIEKVKRDHPGWGDDKSRRYIISREIGGLDIDKYVQQDWVKIGETFDKNKNSSNETEKRLALETAAAVRKSYNDRREDARKEIAKKLDQNKASKLRRSFGLSV